MSGVSECKQEQTATDGQLFNVQCANSNDFIVGRQTNFHAPVTIISCPDQKSVYPFDDKIVIKDELWTQSNQQSLGQQLYKDKSSTVEGCTQSSLPLEKGSRITFHVLATKPLIGIPIFAWILVLLAISISVVIIFTQFTSGLTSDALPDESIAGSGDYPFIGNSSHKFFSKKDWGGLNASSKVAIDEPVKYIVISHTGGNFCYETVTCKSVLQIIQKDQMSRTPAFADISSNFLVGGDGNIYEGRGWGVRSPHGSFANNRNIDITFLGDFSVYDIPTPTQVDAVREIIDWGVSQHHLSTNFTIVAHNSTVATLSPGTNVYSIISQWDHFDPDPKSSFLKN